MEGVVPMEEPPETHTEPIPEMEARDIFHVHRPNGFPGKMNHDGPW